MAGTRWLTACHLRRRWLAHVPLALVVALGATGTLVAAGAAHRTATAYDRYLDRADVSDVLLNPSIVTTDSDRVIRGLPGVRSVTTDALFLAGVGDDGRPRTKAELVAEPAWVQVRGSADGRYAAADRPTLAEGRLPTGRNEAVANVELADAQGIEVGDVLPVSFWSTADDLLSEPGDVVSPIGVERVTVVGIVTLPDEVLPDDLYTRERLVVSPEIAGRYNCVPEVPAPDASLDEAFVQLAPAGCATSYRYYSLDFERGARGVGPALDSFLQQRAELDARLPPAVAAEGIGYFLIATTTADERERVERSTQPTVAALGVLAAAIGAVTIVVLGLAVARELRRTEDDQRQWWRLGATSRERAAVVLAPAMAALVAGLVAAVGLAWLLSPVGPVGSVRSVEPSPGRELSSWAVIGAAALVAAGGLAVTALAAVAARRSGRPDARRLAAGSPPRFVRGVGRPAVYEGIRAAFGGRGAGLVIASCSVAAGVFLAAAVFGASLSTLLSTPASYGWPWDVAVMSGFGYGGVDPEAAEDALDGHNDVARWTALALTNDVSIDGEPVLSMVGLAERAGVDFAVVSGRLPRSGDEVALGTQTAAERGVGMGDEVAVSGEGINARRATVTGLAVLPPLGQFQADRASPGTGAVLPAAMVDRQLLGSLLTFVGVDLAPGADERAALADLRSSLEPEVNMEAVTYRAPVRPAEIVNARSMRAVPLLVGGLLAGAAFVGLAVAVVVSVRGRRRELAILRALGFTGRQVRTSVRVQAVATIVAALVVGVPLGIAVGRVAWRAFAFRLGVVTDPSTPLWWIVATVAGSLSLGVAVAFFPARLAARINPATALRTE